MDASPRNALEFCFGTLAEMTGGNIGDAGETYGRQNKPGFVHMRNVRGKMPACTEPVFLL